VLDALAVLADPGEPLAAATAVTALQRRLGVALTGEATPELLTDAQAAAQAVHAEAHARAALVAEEAAALYEQIAADREAEIATSRARHPTRPTSLTEEEVASSLLAAARSALTAANHWHRAAAAQRAAERGAQSEERRAPAVEAASASSASTREAKEVAGEGAGSSSTRGAKEVAGSGEGAGSASTRGTKEAAGSASTREAKEVAGSAEGASSASTREAKEVAGSADATSPAGADEPGGRVLAWQVRAAQATARARRAAEAAGPWFRSAIDGHLAAGDRLQGSRALEGALKAAALVAEATAVSGACP
jgi:hypothetical protein